MKYLTIVAVALALSAAVSFAQPATPRPNILWVVTEDIGPHLGCYGDSYADTPNLDKLAAKGAIYLHAWSNGPVCAAARTTLITGVYSTSTGGQHMRSMVNIPPWMKMYPQILREAGYYCTNNSKEDYNLQKPGKVWDESSGQAHWKNRKPGQPFFAVFNLGITHESQIRTRPHKWIHDPARAPVPAYQPDTIEVRQDWAQYYDNITTSDKQFAERYKEVEDAGLADDTIVFYYGDHGSGMPRSKRFPYNSGLQVPLVVYIPPRFQSLAPKDYSAGARIDRLVSFVDLAPTLFSLAGVKPPEWVQGHAFLGPFDAGPQPFLYGFRGRMDERIDVMRSVRDERFIYIRNYMPHRIYGQYVSYMFQTPTTAVWRKLYDEGKLNEDQKHFWETKPPEELYDLQNDKWEVHNLANSADHQDELKKLRAAEQKWVRDIRDTGFLPEGEIHSRSKGSSPYEMAHDESKYPLERILDTAEMASRLKPQALPELKQRLTDADSAVRYWAAMGILMRGKDGVNASKAELDKALQDSSPYVRVNAAEALGRYGDDANLKKSLEVLKELAPIDKNGVFVSIAAFNAIDYLGDKADPIKPAIKTMPRQAPGTDSRMTSYVPRLMEHILGEKSPDEDAAPKAAKKGGKRKGKKAATE